MLSFTQLVTEKITSPTKVPAYLLRRIEQPPLIENEIIYRLYLLARGAPLRPRHPDLSDVGEKLELRTLRTAAEYETAVREICSLGLHQHFHKPKNWDALLALKFVLNNTGPRCSILDAGGEIYSPLVEWLYLYGYRDLHVCNIDFNGDFQRGCISYRDADFVCQEFEENTFDVIVSLSVIEHGLNIRATLEEFYRVLKPEGYLILSTDYWPEKVSIEDKHTEYGDETQDWNIFSKREIVDILKTASSIGYSTPDIRQFSANERTINWNNESYTFLYFELQA